MLSDTITKEAQITDMVTYLPLEQSVQKWADMALEVGHGIRKDTKSQLEKAQYDIESAVRCFINAIEDA